MHLDLHRWYRAEGTLGVLTIVETGDKFFTIEKQWAANVPFLSCVPEGNYSLRLWDTTKYPDTWALHGGTVSATRGPVDGFERYACVFHTANHAAQVSGCIGPGLGMQILRDEVATFRSGDAMTALKLALEGPLEHTLTIRQGGIASFC